MLNFRSVDDMDNIIRRKLTSIPDCDCVAGVPRSGMLPASLIALYLNKPLISVDQIGQKDPDKFTERIPLPKEINTVLVVDDSCHTGNALFKVKKRLEPYKKFMRFIYAVVYVTEASKHIVDFYFEEVEQPRVFEWNIMDHIILSNSCVDMDGVLCEDPTPEENDDGEKYRWFLANAKPKFIPHHAIGAIVTCRLEKYRKQTEDWLRRYGVKYNQLFMMDYPDAATRRAAGNHAQYKLNIYNSTNTILFIESDEYQATWLSSMSSSSKPVYCVKTNHFYS